MNVTQVPGNGAGPFTQPVTKILIHTTEGTSIDGAVAAYRQNNSWPHDTVDCMFGHTPAQAHHLAYNVAARSLKNLSGGVETNTAGVIQVEVVGSATGPSAIDWQRFGAEYLGPLCRQLGIPVTSSVHWVAYPASYGQSAPQRLSGSAWLSYRGVLGHEHAPENDHGDPGAIPIDQLLSAAGQEGDMPLSTADLDAIVARLTPVCEKAADDAAKQAVAFAMLGKESSLFKPTAEGNEWMRDAQKVNNDDLSGAIAQIPTTSAPGSGATVAEVDQVVKDNLPTYVSAAKQAGREGCGNG